MQLLPRSRGLPQSSRSAGSRIRGRTGTELRPSACATIAGRHRASRHTHRSAPRFHDPATPTPRSESDADDIRFAGGSGRGRGEVKNPEDAEVLHDVQAFDVDLEGDDESEDHVFGFKDDHADYGDEDLESADEEGGRRAEDDAAAAAPDPDFRRDRRRRKTEYSPVHALYTVDVADPEEAPRGGGGRRDSGRHHRRAEGKYEEEEEGGEAEEKPASIATAAAPRRGDVLDGEVDDFEDGDQVELGSPPAGRRRGAASASTSVFSSSADADSSRDGRTSGRSRARLPEAVPSAFEPSSDALWRVSPSVLQVRGSPGADPSCRGFRLTRPCPRNRDSVSWCGTGAA